MSAELSPAARILQRLAKIEPQERPAVAAAQNRVSASAADIAMALLKPDDAEQFSGPT